MELTSKAVGVLKTLSRGGRPNRSLLYDTQALTEQWKRGMIEPKGKGYMLTEAGRTALALIEP
jgi:hypothetical protein